MITKARVENGELRIPLDPKHEGRQVFVEVTFADGRNKDQNALFWLRNRVLAAELGERGVDLIGSMLNYEGIANLVKIMVMGYNVVKVGEQTIYLPPNSRDLPTTKFSELIEAQDLIANSLEKPIVLPSGKKG